VLEESPCPQGSSRTNFQVLVLVLVLGHQVLVLVLVPESQVLDNNTDNFVTYKFYRVIQVVQRQGNFFLLRGGKANLGTAACVAYRQMIAVKMVFVKFFWEWTKKQIGEGRASAPLSYTVTCLAC